MKWGKVGITGRMSKTSQKGRGFPRLSQVGGLNLGNLQGMWVMPLIHILNKNNNLLYKQSYLKERSVD
jgi:hypothetical protein